MSTYFRPMILTIISTTQQLGVISASVMREICTQGWLASLSPFAFLSGPNSPETRIGGRERLSSWIPLVGFDLRLVGVVRYVLFVGYTIKNNHKAH